MDIGVPVRLHDLTGEDLGVVHTPTPVEPGDLILLEHDEYRITDVIITGKGPLYAFVRAQPAHVRPLVTP